MRFDGDRHYPQHKSVAVLGGIMTLQPHYQRILEENDLDPSIFNEDTAGIWKKVRGADMIILFSGTISHGMAIKARKAASSRGIPLVTLKRSSLSALRKSVSALNVSAETTDRPAASDAGLPAAAGGVQP
jgi:hypothetical protein